jgi:hypothetical protein
MVTDLLNTGYGQLTTIAIRATNIMNTFPYVLGHKIKRVVTRDAQIK